MRAPLRGGTIRMPFLVGPFVEPIRAIASSSAFRAVSSAGCAAERYRPPTPQDPSGRASRASLTVTLEPIQALVASLVPENPLLVTVASASYESENDDVAEITRA